MNNPNRQVTADDCCQKLAWSDLDTHHLQTLVQLAKEEDLSGAGLATTPCHPGDHSSALLQSGQNAKATIRARQPLTLCGIQLAKIVLKAYSDKLSLTPSADDGDAIEKGQTIATIEGPVQAALSAERPLLNFMQMLSGIATQTRRYANALGNSSTRLLDTRKTTPAYRAIEKYAVACGGAWNHRIGLFDRVMLKDNHIASFGNDPRQATTTAVSESRLRFPNLLVEMEIDSIEQIDIVLAANVDIVLLDNFSVEALQEAIDRIQSRAITEASGGITIDALPELATLGLDFISTGALVHQSRWIDIGLDWQ